MLLRLLWNRPVNYDKKVKNYLLLKWNKKQTSCINLTKTRYFAKINHILRVNNFVIFWYKEEKMEDCIYAEKQKTTHLVRMPHSLF